MQPAGYHSSTQHGLTIARLLIMAGARLAKSDVPADDARHLLAHCLQQPQSYLIAHSEDAVGEDIIARFNQLVHRRTAGEPMAYLTGRREFWSLALTVNPHVLTPRPETELLVEVALKLLNNKPTARVADLGTGSGAIAIALASERADLEITATDCSGEALAVAKHNADVHGLNSIQFVAGDWFKPLAGQFYDLIVSNPPYVCTHDPHLDANGVRFEPRGALAAGEDGLDCLRSIIGTAPHHLTPKGWLIVEHGFDQAESVALLMQTHGLSNIVQHKDLAGILRATAGQLKAD